MVEVLDTRLQDREIASRFQSIFGQKLCMYIWYLVPSPLHHHNMHTFSSLGMRWLASDEIKRKQAVVLHGLAPTAECCRTNTNISSRFLGWRARSRGSQFSTEHFSLGVFPTAQLRLRQRNVYVHIYSYEVCTHACRKYNSTAFASALLT